MTKDVKMIFKGNHKFLNCIFILIFGTLILGCKNKEKIYLDYNEVIFHSYQKDIIKRNSSFTVYNEEDEIQLYRTNKEITTRTIDHLNKIKITPIDNAITRLSKTTIDNLHIEEERGLPQIFIVKKDFIKDEIKIIEVEQAFSISEDNFEF